MHKILVLLLSILITAHSFAEAKKANPKLAEIDDEVNSTIYCMGETGSKLCKHFKLFLGHELIEHEGVSVDKRNVILAIRKETLDSKKPAITKSNDPKLIIMSFLFKEPFLKFLKLNVVGVNNLILAVRDSNGKVVDGVKLNYEMFIFMDPIDIVKSVNLALIYGNDRFYKMFIKPTLL